jgi:hypothetical protein
MPAQPTLLSRLEVDPLPTFCGGTEVQAEPFHVSATVTVAGPLTPWPTAMHQLDP